MRLTWLWSGKGIILNAKNHTRMNFAIRPSVCMGASSVRPDQIRCCLLGVHVQFVEGESIFGTHIVFEGVLAEFFLKMHLLRVEHRDKNT
jgi:hypothetical protein